MSRMIWIVALLIACKPDVVTTQDLTLPPDSAKICMAQCRSIGLEMSSVVVIAHNIGCVCAPPPAPGAPAAPQTSAAAGAAGMTAILIHQQAAAAQAPIGSGVSAGGR